MQIFLRIHNCLSLHLHKAKDEMNMMNELCNVTIRMHMRAKLCINFLFGFPGSKVRISGFGKVYMLTWGWRKGLSLSQIPLKVSIRWDQIGVSIVKYALSLSLLFSLPAKGDPELYKANYSTFCHRHPLDRPIREGTKYC